MFNTVFLLLSTYIIGLSLPKLYHRLSNSRGIEVRSLRKLERYGLSLTKITLDIEFFKNCQELGVCPKFMKFNPPKLKVYQEPKKFYNEVVSHQIKILEKEKKTKVSRYNKLKSAICCKVGILDEMTLMGSLTKFFNKKADSIQDDHKRKLLALWKTERTRSPDCLMNLSHHDLSVTEENVLRFGLKHHILPRKVDPDIIKTDIEKTVSSITRKRSGNSDMDEDEEEDNGNYVEINSDFRDKIKAHFNSFISACKNVCSTKINVLFHKTLSKLSKNKDIKVCKFD